MIDLSNDDGVRQALRAVAGWAEPGPATLSTEMPGPAGSRSPGLGRSRRRALATRQRFLAGVAVAATVAAVAGLLVLSGGHEPHSSRAGGGPSVAPVHLAPGQVRLIKADVPRANGDPSKISALVDSNTDFGFDLYRQLAADRPGNLFFSPYSISTALTMTYAGANGRTRDEMAKMLHFTLPESAVHEAFNALDQRLRAPRRAKGAGGPLRLSIANSLWGQADFPFVKRFLDTMASQYGAGMNIVDFAHAAEKARTAINAWVADHTAGKITELIPPGIIDDLTRLVLVNAIRFKAGWVTKFASVSNGTFTTSAGKSVDTPTMFQESSYDWGSGPGWKAVRIPYVGGAHMLVIVPDDLGSFRRSVSATKIHDIDAALRFGRVSLSMPKFAITSDVPLDDALRRLGMRQAFDPGGADFTRLSPRGKELYVKAVLHQATVKVDEEGTEATAATAVVFNEVSGGGPSVVVDRPFVFLVRDDATGAVLFTGQVTDPTK